MSMNRTIACDSIDKLLEYNHDGCCPYCTNGETNDHGYILDLQGGEEVLEMLGIPHIDAFWVLG